EKSDLLYGSGHVTQLDEVLDAYQRLSRLKGLTEVNINKAITWNYVALIMQNLMSGGSGKRAATEKKAWE
ncbi:MAG TPA: hypothetical protein VLD40_01975, partial [Dissulfurispiraceae bacterium]|nr:hypothetical protein [Dissulfurispiraceae bacterium]